MTPFANRQNISTPKHGLSDYEDDSELDSVPKHKKLKSSRCYKSSDKLANRIAALGSDSSFISSDIEPKKVNINL